MVMLLYRVLIKLELIIRRFSYVDYIPYGNYVYYYKDIHKLNGY